MAKWADYLISAVRYNEKKTHIEMVRVHEDLGDKVGSSTDIARGIVITSIKNGNSYVTIFKAANGNWQRGEDVRIITVNGEEFLRTDANEKASDNLGNLPEF
jgi:hypothetical protein